MKFFRFLKKKHLERNIIKFIRYNCWKGDYYRTGIRRKCPVRGINKEFHWKGYKNRKFLMKYGVNKKLIDRQFQSLKYAKEMYFKHHGIKELKYERAMLLNDLNRLDRKRERLSNKLIELDNKIANYNPQDKISYEASNLNEIRKICSTL
ncbi:hypothetical protein BFS06_13940 [Clostridium perfringens]|uniref:Uncharacterized protein n=1 Tax=Clostridium perfringens TaxID=1502 RepID=A0A140GRN0_CLOPF|nr:hypothetical protein [Clostridium perfringens]AMN31189.1 hypothetical protein JFP838_pA0273 [Clostridium perfringens]TBX14307.1 hypothetical protein BFS06_13940 [Clostridium perfringens]